MTAIFLKLINMSITAGWIVLAVMLLRFLFKKMPKQFTCMLWSLAGFRLVFPSSIESIFSLIPSAETVPETLSVGELPEIHSGIAAVDRVVNPAVKISFSHISTGMSGAKALNLMLHCAVFVWLTGMCLMLFYLVSSYLRLRRRMRTAVLLQDNIWQSEFVSSPFILGLIKPRIYIPFHLEKETISHVLAHENAHLARKDHLVKAFAFCLLSVYWFHPLLWAAYVLLCRDIELACDERVLQDYSEEAKKGYLLSLISYDQKKTAGKVLSPACPLAFGEVDTKERIVRAKTWKKPALTLMLPILILCAVAAFCLLTDPKEKLLTAPEPFGHPYQVKSIVYQASWYDFWLMPEAAPLYILTADYQLMESVDTSADTKKSDGFWMLCGEAEEVRLTEKMLNDYIPADPDTDNNVMHNISVYSLVKENEKAWAVHRQDPENPLFYYIMRQKNGDVYLSYGYDTEEFPHIRWIFKLSALKEETLSANTLYGRRTRYIGDNSAVGNIIYNLKFPEDMNYQQFALQTDSEPYEVTITFALSEKNKEAYDAEAPDRQKELALLQKNACIMFSLIENAGFVNFKLVDEADETKRPLTLVYARQWAEYETDCDLWAESSSEESFEVLLIKLDELFDTDL